MGSIAVEVEKEQLSLAEIIALHLLPGAVIVSIFLFIAFIMRGSDMPVLAWMIVAVPLGLLPTELGVLYFVAQREHGTRDLRSVLGYQNKLSPVQYLWMLPLAFVGCIILFTVAGAGDVWIKGALFGWWPAWLDIETLDLAALSWPALLALLIPWMLLVNFLGPIVEELYFRGFLLPRMQHFGRFAPLLNTTLFAIYHFWTPWHIVQRTFGSLPLAFGAQWGNLNIAIATHVLLNTIGTLLTLLSLFATP